MRNSFGKFKCKFKTELQSAKSTLAAALWQQHPAGGPSSGTSNQAQKQHSDSSTLQRHPAAAPPAAAPCTTKPQSANNANTSTLQTSRQQYLAAPCKRCPAAAPCSSTLQRHQQPSSKAQTALWRQHLVAQRHPAAVPGSSTQERAAPAPKPQSADSSTLQQHPAAAPCSSTPQHQHPNSKVRTTLWQRHPESSILQWHRAVAPCSGTVQAPAKQRHVQPNSQAQTAFWQQRLAAAHCSGTLQRHQHPERKQHSKTSTLQRHPAAAPASNMQLFLYLK